MRSGRKRGPGYVSKWLFCLRERSLNYGVIQPDFTPAMKRRVRKQFEYKCFNCGSTKHLHLDHHKPLCLGYALVYGNAAVLCRKCNYAKSGKLPHLFYTKAKLVKLEQMMNEQRAWATRS